MNRLLNLAALPLLAGALILAASASAAPVTSDGWAKQSRGLEFYIEVPMIDNKELKQYGVGRNITAESIINSVRYAGGNAKVRHVVFMMDTGGGALHHAEAMEDVIERHHGQTEFHIVVQNAISAGIWTAFSCDTIFMCDAGTIGGATAYYTTDKGETISAPEIPWIAYQLAKTAKRNGYPPQLIKPLMMMESELHYWTDKDGKKVLSNTPPKSRSAVKNYKHMDRRDTVLTLTTKDAIEIGIAKPIGGFDSKLVGKKIGVPGWTRANHYGKVVDQIGWIYNTTRVWEDQWVQKQLKLKSFPVTRYNRKDPAIVEMLKDRQKHAAVVAALRMMNQALNELPNVHPEKHVYLEGVDGKTVVADTAAWEKDARAARSYATKLNAGIRALAKALEDVGEDRDSLEDIQGPVKQIINHINGIANKGNVLYWKKAG